MSALCLLYPPKNNEYIISSTMQPKTTGTLYIFYYTPNNNEYIMSPTTPLATSALCLLLQHNVFHNASEQWVHYVFYCTSQRRVHYDWPVAHDLEHSDHGVDCQTNAVALLPSLLLLSARVYSKCRPRFSSCSRIWGKKTHWCKRKLIKMNGVLGHNSVLWGYKAGDLS